MSRSIEAWFPALRAHLTRYPLMQPQDLYKLLHQAALGSEHAVVDPQAARAWLERELASLAAGPEEPLFDSLPPRGRILRVHLRPLLARGGDTQVLLGAFLRTAAEFRGVPDGLRLGWQAAVQLAVRGELPFDPQALEDFLAPLQAQGFPALHHSPAYAQAYRPAYRVVARDFCSSFNPVLDLKPG